MMFESTLISERGGWVVRLGCVCVWLLFSAAGGAAQQTPATASLTATERTGEKLFLQRCSLCHLGSAPTYQPWGPPLDGRVTDASEARIRTVIAEGVRNMPGWRYALNPSQIDAIVAYMRKLGPMPVK
jgi:mono/diheme cytochrome c family protein